MVVDGLDHWAVYATSPLLVQAFRWLDEALPRLSGMPEERLEIVSGQLAAIPQTVLTKPRSLGRLEAHRRFIDIQYVVEGEEGMGWAPLERLGPDGDFDVEADVGFYRGECDVVTVRAGSFAIFHPHDAHMPCLQVAGLARTVRKVVMKVAV